MELKAIINCRLDRAAQPLSCDMWIDMATERMKDHDIVKESYAIALAQKAIEAAIEDVNKRLANEDFAGKTISLT